MYVEWHVLAVRGGGRIPRLSQIIDLTPIMAQVQQ